MTIEAKKMGRYVALYCQRWNLSKLTGLGVISLLDLQHTALAIFDRTTLCQRYNALNNRF
jgi:hypothetical protein